ncbi:hypothetical protein DPMN_003357 [Dreissena polymorpha]|uniref:Uncharacterized protein n=1 Tax=Dreissena polymorpha TaxID=45954 RepID=A0A9D4MP60_DREPO|nr:hypothetical protein DPMN_003357 [Dreissena polymorpha]
MYRGHIGNQGAYSFQAREIELEPVAVHSRNSILSMRTRLLLEQLYSDQQKLHVTQAKHLTLYWPPSVWVEVTVVGKVI